MKLNDKHLVAYGISPEGIDKEGFLNKKGELNKGFQRRWCVLKGNLLFYGEKRGDKPNGVIVLEDCSVEVSDADRYSFTISFCGGKTRVYVLSADSEEDMICWMTRISKAPFSYGKMVVKELEKRVEKLRKHEGELLAEQREDAAKLAIANEGTRKVNEVLKDSDKDSIDRLIEQIDSSPVAPVRSRTRNENTNKAKLNTNRKTIAMTAHPMSFNNLLTVGKAASSLKNNILPNVIRSKSSENLHKLTSKSPVTSPIPTRRKFPQSVRRKKTHISTIEHNTIPDAVIDPISTSQAATLKDSSLKFPTKSSFYVLHNQYAASLWTAIRDYETGSPDDLLKFD